MNKSFLGMLKICIKLLLMYALYSVEPVYEFVSIKFRTDNLNCFRAS